MFPSVPLTRDGSASGDQRAEAAPHLAPSQSQATLMLERVRGHHQEQEGIGQQEGISHLHCLVERESVTEALGGSSLAVPASSCKTSSFKT